MTTTYGLTSTGFVLKPLSVIEDELREAFRAQFGNSINLEPSSVFGQIIGIMAEREALWWEELEAVYASQYPDSATNTSLDNVCAITGSVRRAATSTLVTATLIGTAGTAIAAGKMAKQSATGRKFVLPADGAGTTIAANTAWQAGHVYATAGERCTNDGKLYDVSTPGTSAGSGGPTGTAADITDGTVHWRYVGVGTASVDFEVEAVDTGPVPCYASTLDTIDTPVTGWDSVTNLADHSRLGADQETDAALRVRREAEVRQAGDATVESIRADLMQVADVTAVTVFENETDVTNGDGMPPHSVEAVVQGGVDADIAQQLWTSKPAGIQTHGTTTVSVTDSQGTARSVKFTRPTDVDLYFATDLTVNTDLYPADGDDQIKSAVAAWALANYELGEDVHVSQLYAAIFGVAGVVRINSAFVDDHAGPDSLSFAIGARELAVFDTARVAVTKS